MMHFELKINGEEIVKVSVVRVKTEDDGNHIYDWTAWRPCAELPLRLDRYAQSVVVHREDDGIEELAIKVLTMYRKVLS